MAGGPAFRRLPFSSIVLHIVAHAKTPRSVDRRKNRDQDAGLLQANWANSMRQHQLGFALFLICGASIWITPEGAQAAPQHSVQNLLVDCSQTVGSASYQYCLGVIVGASAIMGAAGVVWSDNPSQTKPIVATCGTAGIVTYGAYIQAFVNWATAHPEQWSEPDYVGVATAIGELWPC